MSLDRLRPMTRRDREATLAALAVLRATGGTIDTDRAVEVLMRYEASLRALEARLEIGTGRHARTNDRDWRVAVRGTGVAARCQIEGRT